MTIADVHRIIKRSGPLSTEDISSYLGISTSTISRQIKSLRNANRIYIADYLKQPGEHGPRIILYAAGDKADVARPVYKRKSKPSRAKKPRVAKPYEAPKPFVPGIWGGLMR